MSLFIRDLKKSEIHELSRLATNTWLETFGDSFSKEQCDYLVKKHRSIDYFEGVFGEVHTLVALLNQKMIGYVQFGPVKSDFKEATDEDRELGRLYVDSARQGQGIGKALLEKALSHPDLKQAENIFLDVWEKNPKAIMLYQKYGFKIVGEIERKIGDEYLSTDLIMKRNQKAN